MADYIDPFETKANKTPGYTDPFASGNQAARYSITEESGWETIPNDGKAAVETIDTTTGRIVKGTKKDNQFVPADPFTGDAKKHVKFGSTEAKSQMKRAKNEAKVERKKKTYGKAATPEFTDEAIPDMSAYYPTKNTASEPQKPAEDSAYPQDDLSSYYKNAPPTGEKPSETVAKQAYRVPLDIGKMVVGGAERLLRAYPQAASEGLKASGGTFNESTMQMDHTQEELDAGGKAYNASMENFEKNKSLTNKIFTQDESVPMKVISDLTNRVVSGVGEMTGHKELVTNLASFFMDAMVVSGAAKVAPKFAEAIKSAPKAVQEAYAKSPRTVEAAWNMAKQNVAKGAQAVKSAVSSTPEQKINTLTRDIEQKGQTVFKPEKRPTHPGERVQNIESADRLATDMYQAVQKGDIPFLDKEGVEVFDRAPHTRAEVLQVAEQQMPKIWDRITAAIEQTGGKGVVTFDPLIRQLGDKINYWSESAATKYLVKPASDIVADLIEDQQARGGQPINRVLDDLKNWGNRRKDKFSAVDSVDAQVIDPIIDYIRKGADDAIDAVQGGSNTFLADRKLYSDYRRYIKNIVNDATKYYKDAEKSGINQFDVIAATGGLGALLAHSPKGIVLSVAMEALNHYRKTMSSPDRPVKGMFGSIKKREEQKGRLPKGPTSNLPATTEQPSFTTKPYEGEVIPPQRPQAAQRPQEPVIEGEIVHNQLPSPNPRKMLPEKPSYAPNFKMAPPEQVRKNAGDIASGVKEATSETTPQVNASEANKEISNVLHVLQNEVKSEGNNVKAIAAVALKYKIPPGLLNRFLSATEKEREILFPMLQKSL